MLERSRRRFEEGSRLVEEAQQIMGEIQQALIGSPRASPEDSEEVASRLLASLKASGSDMPESLCGTGLVVSETASMSRKRAPVMCEARNSAWPLRPLAGMNQLASTGTTSAWARFSASQPVETRSSICGG